MKKYYILVLYLISICYSNNFAFTANFDGLNSQFNLLNSLNIVKILDVPTSESEFTINTENRLVATASCQDITVYLDATGNITIAEDAVNNGSTGTTITFDTDITSFTCADIGSNTVVLTVTDIDATSDTCTATVTVVDNLPPTASNLAAVNVQCAADVPAVNIADVNDEADNCAGTITVAHVSDVSDGNSNPEVITRTYSVTDAAGNSINVTQLITVDDTTNPTASNLAAVNVQCAADVPAVNIADVNDEADNCAGTITVAHVSDVSDGNSNPEVITRTYSVTDAAGNSINVTQLITVDDTTNPTASNLAAVNVQCAADVPAVNIADVNDEADNCAGTITVAHVSDVSDGNSNPEVITRTYSVTDAAGNSINVTQLITVDDTTNPTASNLAAVNVQCAADVPAVNIADVNDEADNCAGTITVAHVSDVSDGNSNPEVITRTYSVTDAAGNSINVTQLITVDDTTNPTASNLPAVNVQCAADVPAVNIADVFDEADNCAGTITVAHVSDVSDGNSNPEVITRTYSVTDAAGNSINVTQLITVDDTTNPTASNLPAVNVQCAADVPAVNIADVFDEADNCAGTITVAHVSDVSDGNSNPEVITRTYSVTDAAGNSINVTQLITVDDTTNPTASNLAAVNVQCAADVPAVNIADVNDEADNCAGTITVAHVSDVSDGNSNPEVITRTYSVTDAAGNSINVTQLITVDDTTNPTASNLAAVNVQCAADVPAVNIADVNDEADNCAGTITVAHVSDVSDGNSNPEVITRTYSVTDAAGNSINVTQLITVDDTTNPTASNLAAVNVQCAADVPAVNIADVFDEADNCAGTITVAHISDVSDGNSNPEVITRTYSVTDAAGNSINVTQLITVDDTINPTITCPVNITTTTSNDGTGNCTTTVALGNPAVSDNCTAAGSLTITNNAPAAFPIGTTTVTWTVTDTAGNQNTCTQNVTVIDNENPTITCPANVTVSANASCMATGVTLGTPTTSDNCGVASVTNDAPSSFPLGNTTVTWTVTDNAGLTATCTQTVTVNDTTPPTITCPGDQNVNFDTNCEFSLQDYKALATTSDNCDNNITVTQTPAPGTLITGTVTVTLTATDDANNASTCTFDVIPSDNINPTAVAQNIAVYLAPNGTVNIAALDLENGSSDNCGIVARTVTPSSFNCGDVGVNPVTYTVYDNAGNNHSTTANVTIVDNTPPTMLCNDFVVVVDAITRVATIQATDVDNGSNDACGIASLSVSPSVFAESPNAYTTTTTLTATDVNGNTNTCIANVTVEPPKNQFTYLTGEIVNPIPDNPQPPSALIEVTACPDDFAVPRDVEFTLQAIGTYNLQPSDVNYWEYSNDNGETWTQIPSTAGILTYTLTGITSDTFVRLNITDNSDPLNPIVKTSAEAYVRYLPPNEPPVVVSQSAEEICLGESVTIIAESFFDQPNGQFGEGGEFNHAQPDGWRVDGIDGNFPAGGNNTNRPDWRETNSNQNRFFSGINYDTSDNTKFAIAHGIGNTTTLETPVFSTIGMTSAEAIMSFYTGYYFCNGGYGEIELSFDSGNTYSVALNTMQGDDLTSGNNLGTMRYRQGGNCNNQVARNINFRYTSLDLGPYTGLSGLRVRFTFHGSTSQCQNVVLPAASGNTCGSNPGNIDVASGWAIDDVGFAFAQVDDELEWTDEDGNVIAIGTTATVTPVTPGVRQYGVTALVNDCRADNDDGTNFVTVETSLAYAGQDYTPLDSECGESVIQLNAYDNTRNAAYNFNKGAWENNLYVVPAGLDPIDANNNPQIYNGTGVTGEWTLNPDPGIGSCGNNAAFSSNSDPDATFTADPGTYTLRWTITIPGAGPNGTNKTCFDEITVTIKNCNTINFDGVNDNITFRNNYNFNGPFSIETWVKPNSVNGTRTVLSKKDAADNTKGYALNIVGGQVVFNWYNNSGTGSVTSGANTIGTDRWYHIAVTFDGTQYILYVDGIQLGSANGSAPSTTPANIEAILGAMDQAPPINTPTNYFHGWIDELKIWNNALSIEHIRQMMNQRIEASGSDVIGAVIPTRINGKDANFDGLEDVPLSWNNLDGYYRMNVTCGDLAPYKGVSGRLRNITTSQQKTAPLPYTSRANGTWTTDNTWTNFPVWDSPNNTGINGTPIDWNIVRTAHNITSGDKDITVLGLLVDNNELSIEDPGTPLNETNDGQMLWVTKYLKIDGKLDLVGESQLIQKRYNPNQFGGSIFDNTSTGYAERDQQGQVNPFNYNYFSTPFAPNNATVNNENTTNTFTIGSVLRDGTTTVVNPINRNIVWTSNLTAAGGNPTLVSTRWLYAYNDNVGNTYSEWEYLNNSGSLNIGLGYTMKGSGNATTEQNYVFVGKPNNGTISNNVSPETGGLANDILLGNPYPSAIDANEFIKDNIPLLNPDNSPSQANSDSSESTNGTLYFWEHYPSNNTHILRDYQGGYATYNLSGGIAAVTPPATEDGVIIVGGSGTIIPKRYVPVAQGFFVTGSPGGGLIKFHNDQRVFAKENTSSSVFFEPNKTVQETEINTRSENFIQRIRVNFKSPEGAERQLLLAFTPNNEADDGYNYGYDAPNYDTFPSDLSWSINNERYVIQGVGEFDDTKKYPFILEVGNSGEIEISLDDLENFDNSIDVYIYDALLGTYTKFNDAPFKATLSVNDYTERFYLAFNNEESLSTPETEIDSIRVYYLNDTKEIYINWANSYDIKEIQLINIIGQTIKTYTDIEPINSHEIRVPVKNISEGNYVIKVKNSHGMTTNKKVVIKQ